MLEQLKKRLNEEEAALKAKDGKVCIFSDNGPVSLGLFKALIEVVEAQARDIEELKKACNR
jgi:hypothetical protein